MNINTIIYETTREIYNLEDKLKIATIFLFCNKISAKKFAELLYTENHTEFISNLQDEFACYEVDFKLNFSDRNIKNSFRKTIEKVRNSLDANGYYKALFDKDPFALVIDEIVNYDFDNAEILKFSKNLAKQLKLDF